MADPSDFDPSWEQLLRRSIVQAWLAGITFTTFIRVVHAASSQFADPEGYRDTIGRLVQPFIVKRKGPLDRP